MDDSYEVIEPRVLARLLGAPIHHEFAVAILEWLIPQIYSAIGPRLDAVQLSVICVTYVGSYPAIGARYGTPVHEELGSLIESTANALIRDRPIAELVGAIAESKISWYEVTERLLRGAG